MREKFLLKSAAVAALFCTSSLAGPSWTEPPGVDAGSDPTSAQSPTGGDRLSSIGGSLDTALSVTAADSQGIDLEDVFRIRICDPVRFCAKTEANFDSQVWLFADSGQGLLGNDNTRNSQNGVVFPPANDGTQQDIPGPGVYLVAISVFDNDPLADNGLPIFFQETRTERSGPDGKGGGSPLTNWTRPPGTSGGGSYLISLEGAAFPEDDCTNGPYVTNPCVPAVSQWGVATLLIVLAIGGTIMVGRKTPATVAA